MILLIIIIAIAFTMVMNGAFNDLIARRIEINKARSGWKNNKEKD